MYRPDGSGRDLYLMGRLGPSVKQPRDRLVINSAKLEQRHSPPARFYPSGSGRDLYLQGGKGRYWESRGKAYSGKKTALGSAIFTESIFDTPKRHRPMSPREREVRNEQKSKQDTYMTMLSKAKYHRPKTAGATGSNRTSNSHGTDYNGKRSSGKKALKKPLVFIVIFNALF